MGSKYSFNWFPRIMSVSSNRGLALLSHCRSLHQARQVLKNTGSPGACCRAARHPARHFKTAPFTRCGVTAVASVLSLFATRAYFSSKCAPQSSAVGRTSKVVSARRRVKGHPQERSPGAFLSTTWRHHGDQLVGVVASTLLFLSPGAGRRKAPYCFSRRGQRRHQNLRHDVHNGRAEKPGWLL